MPIPFRLGSPSLWPANRRRRSSTFRFTGYPTGTPSPWIKVDDRESKRKVIQRDRGRQGAASHDKGLGCMVGFGGLFFRCDRMDLKRDQFGIDDRRKHTRYQLSVPIQLSVTDRPTIQGLTIEISEGGFGAAIGASLEVGSRVTATPIGYNEMLSVVRWIRGRAYGFEFLDLSSEQQQRIRDHCRKLPLHCRSLDF
jgi:hypothetical protein